MIARLEEQKILLNDPNYIRTVRAWGKNAIAVPSLDKIPFIINILITAVRNGELDDQLAPAKKPATAVTTRKAA
jgi:hypothetical protein